MKIELSFAWYDFWVGLFWDKKKRILYICPLPMVVIKIQSLIDYIDDKYWLDVFKEDGQWYAQTFNLETVCEGKTLRSIFKQLKAINS